MNLEQVSPAVLQRDSRRPGGAVGRDLMQAGLDNIETVEAEMEAILFPIDSVDHVISNGTINLSPHKQRVVAECARVLRPRGTLTVADLTRIHERQPLGIDDLALYLLFTPDVLALMRRQIPPRRSARSGSPS